VPRPYPQTPWMAEWWGFLAAGQHAMGSMEVATDCKAVVTTWSKPWQQKLSANNRAAGCCRYALSFPRLQCLEACRHIYSYRSIKSAVDEQDRIDILHNAFADAQAALGADVPEHRCDRSEELELASDKAKDIAAAMAKFLTEHCSPFALDGVARSRPNPAPRVTFGHDWHRVPRSVMHVCRVCGLAARQPSDSPCFGRDRPRRGFGPGHSVVKVWMHNVEFYFCRRCGSHGSWKLKNLAMLCNGEPQTRPQRWTLRTLLGGAHPRTKVPLTRERR